MRTMKILISNIYSYHVRSQNLILLGMAYLGTRRNFWTRGFINFEFNDHESGIIFYGMTAIKIAEEVSLQIFGKIIDYCK